MDLARIELASQACKAHILPLDYRPALVKKIDENRTIGYTMSVNVSCFKFPNILGVQFLSILRK